MVDCMKKQEIVRKIKFTYHYRNSTGRINALFYKIKTFFM